MYQSTYTRSHSKVFLEIYRLMKSQKIVLFQAMLDLFLQLKLKVNMGEVTLLWRDNA